jgi:hypothetical protein
MIMSIEIMSWAVVERLPSRTISYLHKVMKMLKGTDEFDGELMATDESYNKIIEMLEETRTKGDKPLKYSTKASYLSAVCRGLETIGCESERYKAKRREYEEQDLIGKLGTTPKQKEYKEILEHMLTKGSTDMSVIAGLIYYGCSKNIQIQCLLNARCDEDNGEDNYLDLDNGIFKYRFLGKGTETCDVPETYVEFIRGLGIKTWLLGSKRTSAQSLSNMFKRRAKISYKELRDGYLRIDDVVSETETSSSESSAEVSVDESTETKRRIMIKKRDAYEWKIMDDEECSVDTNNMRRRDLCSLQKALYGTEEKFYPSLFYGMTAYRKVEGYLSRKYKPNTIKNYLSAVCKGLNKTNSGIRDYGMYYLRYMEAKRSAEAHRPQLEPEHPGREGVIDYEELQKRASELLRGDVEIPVKIISLLIVDSINWERETVIGIVRISDVVATKFEDDGESSYIDLKTMEWHIRAEKTKNRVSRKIKLSDLFTAELVKIYGGKFPEWLTGKKYSASTAGDVIEKEMGYGPKIARISYATYLHRKNIPCRDFERICTNMGHGYQTSLTDYVRV